MNRKWKAVELKWPVQSWDMHLEQLETDGWVVFSTQVEKDGLIVLLVKPVPYFE